MPEQPQPKDSKTAHEAAGSEIQQAHCATLIRGEGGCGSIQACSMSEGECAENSEMPLTKVELGNKYLVGNRVLGKKKKMSKVLCGNMQKEIEKNWLGWGQFLN